jgi:hypothetical protein
MAGQISGDVRAATSKMSSRPSCSCHCSPTSAKPNPAIVARDATLPGLIVARTVRTLGFGGGAAQ